MSISQNVKNLLAQKKLTQKDLSVYLGVGSSTVNNWIKLDRSIPSEYIIPICEFIGVSPYYLLAGKENSFSLPADEQELLDNYRRLSERDKGRVFERAQTLYEISAEKSESAYTPIISLRHSLYMVSAGTGYELDAGDSWDEIEVPDTPTARKADFCLTISGDSMEPRYHNGDIVLVRHCNAIDENEIGIFRIENKGYIKRYGLDRLISLNPKYDDILFSDYDSQDIQCLGLVIGKA